MVLFPSTQNRKGKTKEEDRKLLLHFFLLFFGREKKRGEETRDPKNMPKPILFLSVRPKARQEFFCPTPSSFFPPCFQERYGKFLPGQKVEGRGGGGGRRRRRRRGTWSSASLFFFFFEREEEEEEEAESLVCANPSFTSAEEAQGEISPWGVNIERKNTLALFSVQIKKSNMLNYSHVQQCLWQKSCPASWLWAVAKAPPPPLFPLFFFLFFFLPSFPLSSPVHFSAALPFPFPPFCDRTMAQNGEGEGKRRGGGETRRRRQNSDFPPFYFRENKTLLACK